MPLESRTVDQLNEGNSLSDYLRKSGGNKLHGQVSSQIAGVEISPPCLIRSYLVLSTVTASADFSIYQCSMISHASEPRYKISPHSPQIPTASNFRIRPTESNFFLEACSSSAAQEIPNLLWNRKFHGLVHKCPPQYLVHIFAPCFSNIF
jgi:hypothetical protein